jgi:lysozyme
MNVITNDVVDLVKQWEGLRLSAYRDVAGVITIGYGHTGNDVYMGLTITEVQAEQFLRQDLATASLAVVSGVTVALTDNQFGALSSFVLNVGGTAFRASTLLKKLNAGDYAAVPMELTKWNKITLSNGKKAVSPGLTNRRAAEIGLWSKGSYVASSSAPASTPTPVANPHTAAAGGATAGALGIGALAEGVNQLAPAVPFLQGLGTLPWYLLAGVAVVAIGGIIYYLTTRSRA